MAVRFSSTLATGPLAMIAILIDRFGSYVAAATLMVFGDVPSSRQLFPEVDSATAHLRKMLGDQTYAAYALEQMDLSCAELG